MAHKDIVAWDPSSNLVCRNGYGKQSHFESGGFLSLSEPLFGLRFLRGCSSDCSCSCFEYEGQEVRSATLGGERKADERGQEASSLPRCFFQILPPARSTVPVCSHPVSRNLGPAITLIIMFSIIWYFL